MNVIILAAGIGSRLRPLTHIKPKGMVKVNGLPIIEHQIKAYLNAGIPMSKINIAAGYKASFITDFINANYPEINIITNKDYDTTNNMYSLSICLNKISPGTTLISNGDCVYEQSIIKDLVNSPDGNFIACDNNSFTEENMKIIVNQGKVTHISKEISRANAFGNSIDLYKLNKKTTIKLNKVIVEILQQDKNLWTELALDDLFNTENFKPFDIQNRKWMEIDNYDDLYTAELKFSNFNLSEKRAFIFDLDGTIYIGNKPIQNTINFINANKDRYEFYFLTNNTSKNITDYEEKLLSLGIQIENIRVISPLAPLTDYLNKHNIKKIHLVGNSNMKSYLTKNVDGICFSTDKETCQAVVLGYDTELNYEKLKTAALLLHNEAIKYIATHEDLVCPTEDGNIPDIGSIMKLIEVTTKRKATTTFGKPNLVLIEHLLKKYKNNEIAVVGDRLYTDKLLADNANLDFVLVLSGEAKREDVENLDIFPKIIVKDCGDLLKKPLHTLPKR